MSSPVGTPVPGTLPFPESVRSFPNRVALALAGAAILVHAVLAWILRARTIGTGNDDAVYLLLARALREGHYRELFYSTTPVHSQYPPGYPGILAISGVPLAGDLSWVILVNIVFSCAALALVFDVVRRWSPMIAVVLVSALAINPSLVLATARVQSEPMFMAMVILALWALRPGADVRLRWVSIVAVIIATLTRSAGVAIIGAIFLHFVLERAWRPALTLAFGSILTIGPWLVWTAVAPQQVAGRSYFADALLTVPPPDTGGVPPRQRRAADQRSAVERFAHTLITRIRVNVRHYVVRALPSRLSVPTMQNTPIDNLAWLLVMLVTAGAGMVAARSRWRVALVALVLYGALLIIWPYAVSRFLLPMLPVFVAFMLLGAWKIGGRFGGRAALVAAMVVAGILIAGAANDTSAIMSNRDSCDAADEAGEECEKAIWYYTPVAHRVDSLAPGDAPIFTSKEGTFYYLVGRQAVTIYPAVDWPADRLAQYLRESGAAMIFLPHLKFEEQKLGPPLMELCESLTDAGSPRDDMLVLYVRPPAEGESNACAVIERWQATW